MFEECLRLAEQYYKEHQTDPSFNTRAGIELSRRIKQLDYFLGEVRTRVEAINPDLDAGPVAMRALEARGLQWTDHWPDDIRSEFESLFRDLGPDATFEIESLTEGFYLVVGRLRELLRMKLPGLSQLTYGGAIRVRDKLVEHYEPDGEAPRGIGSYFAIHRTAGPQLRLEQTIQPDAGLYPNAEDLACALEAKLRAAVSS